MRTRIRIGLDWVAPACVALTSIVAPSSDAATLAPLTTFGGGDGWRAPYEILPGDAAGTSVPDPTNPGVDPDRYLFLGYDRTTTLNTDPLEANVNAGNLERGLAYNPTTGHLILVSRNDSAGAVQSIRILDGATGVDLGFLNRDATVTGGTFAYNMVGVADDGAIYISNLTIQATTTPFKVYRWANETATAPTVAYSGTPLAGVRIGDTFDVLGGGVNTQFAAGYSNSPVVAGNNSFATFSTTDAVSYVANHVNLAAGTDPGDFRLGITFVDSDTVVGKNVIPTRIVDVSGGTGTVAATFSTDGSSLRPMDFAVVGGRPLLALVEASGDFTSPIARARIFVYDITDTTLPLAQFKVAEGSNLPTGVIQNANGNGVGQVKFGAIDGDVATIYAMSTNNGIQAFQLTLDPVVAAEDADFDDDSDIDGEDFLAWQRGYGIDDGTAQPIDGDANGDGNVNDADFQIFQNQFGEPLPAAAAVPEPATLALLVVSALASAACRRRT